MSADCALVVGLGLTGESIARYLMREHRAFVMADTRADFPQPKRIADQFQTDVYLGHVPDTVWERITEVIASPGVPLDAPLMLEAAQRRLPIIGDIECFARAVDVPVIAITGTNGKSTVTALVGEMAKAAMIRVAVGGNIGTPVLDLLEKANETDLFVLELSSFQLDLTTSLKPIASTILNVTPDHLDRHASFADYVRAKQRIYHHARVQVYERSDAYTFPVHPAFERMSFGLDKPEEGQFGLIEQDGQIFIGYGESMWINVNALTLKGRHNWLNAMAACALAYSSGIPRDAIILALKTFRGLQHRTQFVRSHQQVDWVDDSKGTNVGATLSAITGIGQSIQGKIVLIAGGVAKGATFEMLADAAQQYLRAAIIIGQDGDKIAQVLPPRLPVAYATDMEHAVQLAQSNAKPGDTVLLSPACASFDMFKDYHHRGEVFVQAVSKL